MFTNLKLSTVGWIFIALLIITSVAIYSVSAMVNKNVSVINDTWNVFQTDRSEKARLEVALRSAIGFGGMVHDFKNYLLRKEPWYLNHVESHIGAAHAILHQYVDLEVSPAEKAAIEDIESVIDAYLMASKKAEILINHTNSSVHQIDRAVTVDDRPALRGLQALRDEVKGKQANQEQLSKGRILADLRAAIGYGGMIHEFKNYVLYKNSARIEIINNKLQEASLAIYRYRQHSLNQDESTALETIESTLNEYQNSIATIQAFVIENISSQDIDSTVRINDNPALDGLHKLDRAINAQVAQDSRRVDKALAVVKKTILYGTWVAMCIIVIAVVITIWLFRTQIIKPISKLTKNMTQLANNHLDIEIFNPQHDNEVGEMARSVLFFKTNMLKRKEAEDRLADANREMSKQLQDIKLLRENAEQQAQQALSLAEGLSAARESAENAMGRAESNEQLVSSILNTVRDGIITIDAQGIIETFNPGAENLFGYTAKEVIGKNVTILMPEQHRPVHDDYLKHFLDGKSKRDQNTPIEQFALRKDGSYFPVEITLNTMQIAGSIKTTSSLRDITERKKWEEEIKRMAMTDPLTGLSNRNQYNKRLDETEKQALRFNTQFALLQIDLDKFKPVNDTYGHPVGDLVLQHVAKILIKCCREVDTIARLGGDEFSIILTGIHKLEDASITAERIINDLSQPIDIDNQRIQIGASIGISFYPDDDWDTDVLIKMADEALYLSKNSGRNTYCLYSDIQRVADNT